MSDIQPPNQDLASLSSARLNLRPYLDSLAECLRAGWSAWEELGKDKPKLRFPLDQRARACFVYCHICAAIRSRFETMSNVRISDRRGFLELTIANTYVIRFKKLDKRFRSSNVQTGRQKSWFNVQLELPGLPPDAVRLVAGYKLNLIGTEIEHIAITRPSGRTVTWAFEISEAADEGQVSPMPGREPKPATPRSTLEAPKEKKEGEDDDPGKK